jgi:hypothetical protein
MGDITIFSTDEVDAVIEHLLTEYLLPYITLISSCFFSENKNHQS